MLEAEKRARLWYNAKKGRRRAAGEGRAMRLLLAEDERELSAALVAILEHNRYAVDPVYDGADALAYAESGHYDGIILDIMMPKLSGLEVLARLREQGVAVPVLMLTARAEVEDRIAGLDGGADDYLTKPFAMGELLARIRAMTRRREVFAPNTLSFGNLALDRERFELRCGERTQRLANKEFQMLEMLLENPGRYISTAQFMEHVWGYDAEAEVNVVWVTLSGLRKKLAGLGAAVAIKAARGIGYRLEEQS